MEVGFDEARANWLALLERVERGEEITITRHGHPVARLMRDGRGNYCAPPSGNR